MRHTMLFLLLIAGLFLLVGCQREQGSAAVSVENYLQALVNQDTDRVSTLVCKDWETDAIMEVDAFAGVKAELQDVSCSQISLEGSTAQVQCQGKILATYNNEQQEFSLQGRTYKVIQEAGDWRVCGYP
jgi:uncharacterized lipoprotein YajG